jgi:hypothetical protein
MERLSIFVSDMIIIEFIIMGIFFLYNFLDNNVNIFSSYKSQSFIMRLKNTLMKNSEGFLFVFIVYTILIKVFIMLCNYKW